MRDSMHSVPIRRAAGLGAVTTAVLGTAVVVSAQRPSAPVVLPDGPGKELVTARCSQCHPLSMITGSGGYTREGWTNLLQSMTKPEPEEVKVLAEYLAAHFPEKPRPQAVVIPGPASVQIKEWLVPTLGQR